MPTVSFNKFYCIDCLPESDGGQGYRFYDDVAPIVDKNEIMKRTEYIKIAHKNNLFDFFESTKTKTQQGERPILHFLAHGNDCGLGLGKDQFVQWQELKNDLVVINVNTRLNLLVTLASCRGYYITRLLTPADRAPCWGILAPSKDEPGGLLDNAFLRFYAEVFNSYNLNLALKEIKGFANKNGVFIGFTECDRWFREVMIKYYKDYCENEVVFSERIARAICDIKGGVNMMTKGELLCAISEIESKIKSPEWYIKFRKKYFMLDLYPEHEERWSFTNINTLPPPC